MCTRTTLNASSLQAWASEEGTGGLPTGSWNLIFSIRFLAKTGCFLSSEWVESNFSTFDSPWKNFSAAPRKIHYCPPPGKNPSEAHVLTYTNHWPEKKHLSVVIHGFIGCYDVVHSRLCWRGQTVGRPQTSLAWRRPFSHITGFYPYHLMSSKISARATEWGPAEVFPLGSRTC